jgi:hypothetical protein
MLFGCVTNLATHGEFQNQIVSQLEASSLINILLDDKTKIAKSGASALVPLTWLTRRFKDMRVQRNATGGALFKVEYIQVRKEFHLSRIFIHFI